MKSNSFRFILAFIVSGLGMWIVAGLWHNLILPGLYENTEAHHEGIGVMLIAYFILSLIMTYIYARINKTHKPILEGLSIGAIIGILWVFPHGIVMAGAHDGSVIYEVKNAVWHSVEQGIGGVMIAVIYKRS